MDEADAENDSPAGEEPEQVEDDGVTVAETELVEEEAAVGDAKESEEESAPEPDSGKATLPGGDQADPMKAVVQWIKETELVPSDRQDEISKVVKDRLNTALIDYADMEGMPAAIESLGGKVSTWIDAMASEAEREMEPLMEKAAEKTKFSAPQGTVYHIKKGNNNCYRVTRVNVIA